MSPDFFLLKVNYFFDKIGLDHFKHLNDKNYDQNNTKLIGV